VKPPDLFFGLSRPQAQDHPSMATLTGPCECSYQGRC
jgi:hypothetical protein